MTNQWQIYGTTKDTKTLFINSKEIPIQDDNSFQFNIHSTDTLNELTLTSLTTKLVLYTETLGLSMTPYQHLPYDATSSKASTTLFAPKDVEPIIHQQYYKMGWKAFSLTPTQKTMINVYITFIVFCSINII